MQAVPSARLLIAVSGGLSYTTRALVLPSDFVTLIGRVIGPKMQNILWPIALSLVFASAGFSQSYTIKTFAGGGDEASPELIGDNGSAINSLLLNPSFR